MYHNKYIKQKTIYTVLKKAKKCHYTPQAYYKYLFHNTVKHSKKKKYIKFVMQVLNNVL